MSMEPSDESYWTGRSRRDRIEAVSKVVVGTILAVLALALAGLFVHQVASLRMTVAIVAIGAAGVVGAERLGNLGLPTTAFLCFMVALLVVGFILFRAAGA